MAGLQNPHVLAMDQADPCQTYYDVEEHWQFGVVCKEHCLPAWYGRCPRWMLTTGRMIGQGRLVRSGSCLDAGFPTLVEEGTVHMPAQCGGATRLPYKEYLRADANETSLMSTPVKRSADDDKATAEKA